MSAWVGGLVLVLAAAPPAFGPMGSARHPVVGPVAAVPGNGPEPVVPPAPEEVSLSQVQRARGSGRPAGANPLYLSFLIYRDFLTQVDGSRCAHYPTCSAYGAQAVGRYNVLGVLMTMDRLWRSGDSSSVRSHRLVHGVGPTPRFYDPVDDSTFWLGYPWVAWLGPSIPVLDVALGREKEGAEEDAAPAASLPARPAPGH